ncbi:MAG: hypothetical protein MJ170_00790 [Alphaproteobacteria bacterium]|nr:hypothetical protein [Alphaproteobacteria bacterium]
MKKILFAVFLLLPCVCMAEEVTPAVVNRPNCGEVKKQIDELKAVDTLTDEESTKLKSLQDTYNTQCVTQRTSKIRTAAVRTASSVVTEQPVATEEIPTCDSLQAEIEKLQAQYDKMCVVAIAEPESEPLTPEQIQDLRANGLCPDESKPNKFGCCDGERFKDVGNMEFKCCPNDGGECLPLVVPVKE